MRHNIVESDFDKPIRVTCRSGWHRGTVQSDHHRHACCDLWPALRRILTSAAWQCRRIVSSVPLKESVRNIYLPDRVTHDYFRWPDPGDNAILTPHRCSLPWWGIEADSCSLSTSSWSKLRVPTRQCSPTYSPSFDGVPSTPQRHSASLAGQESGP